MRIFNDFHIIRKVDRQQEAARKQREIHPKIFDFPDKTHAQSKHAFQPNLEAEMTSKISSLRLENRKSPVYISKSPV